MGGWRSAGRQGLKRRKWACVGVIGTNRSNDNASAACKTPKCPHVWKLYLFHVAMKSRVRANAHEAYRNGCDPGFRKVRLDVAAPPATAREGRQFGAAGKQPIVSAALMGSSRWAPRPAPRYGRVGIPVERGQ